MIPESEVIVELLAGAFPQSGLRPVAAIDAARARVLTRIADLYQVFEKGDLLAAYPKIAGYWSRIQQEPAARRIIGEIDEGLRALRGG